jgi:hypothetical protein
VKKPVAYCGTEMFVPVFVHKISSLVPTLRQANPLHNVQFCFLKINLNIIPPSTLGSSQVVDVFHISLS